MFRYIRSVPNHFVYVSLIFLCFSNLHLHDANVNHSIAKSINPNQISTFNATIFVDEILEVLLKEVQYENASLKGWNQVNNSRHHPDVLLYNGYQVGIAGVGDFLLDAHLAGHSNLTSILNDTITHFLTTAEGNSVDGIFWPRFANLDSDGWSSNRYGSSGIIKYLARMQSENMTDNLEEIISDAVLWLKNLQEADGSIAIEPGSYVTTDHEYGAAGIGSSMLLTSDYLQINSYIEFAEEMGNWIIQKGDWKDGRFRVPWTPFGEETEFDDFFATGYGIGSAGFIEFFIDLYESTNNNTYKEIAVGIANDLVSLDQGGYWPDGSVAYITTLYGGNDGLVGLYAGASGIALQLLKMYSVTNNPEFLESSARAEKFVELFVHENGSVSIGMDYLQVHRTGLGVGGAGVAKYYLDLYEKFGLERHLQSSELILSHLYETFNFYGLIPIDEHNIEWGDSFNIDTGLAGIGKVLLQYIEIVRDLDRTVTIGTSNTSNDITTDYESIYSTAIPNTEPVPSSKSEDSKTYSPIIMIPVVLILNYFKRRKQF